jgi:hypothetical protein
LIPLHHLPDFQFGSIAHSAGSCGRLCGVIISLAFQAPDFDFEPLTTNFIAVVANLNREEIEQSRELEAVTACLGEAVATGLNLLTFLYDIDGSRKSSGDEGGDSEDGLEKHFYYRLLRF